MKLLNFLNENSLQIKLISYWAISFFNHIRGWMNFFRVDKFFLIFFLFLIAPPWKFQPRFYGDPGKSKIGEVRPPTVWLNGIAHSDILNLAILVKIMCLWHFDDHPKIIESVIFLHALKTIVPFDRYAFPLIVPLLNST